MATTNDTKPDADSSKTPDVTKINVKIVDNDKNTQLHYYAARGLTDNVSRDLVDKQKIDIENYLGWTALMMACKNGHLEMVQLLLEIGADPSRKNRFGMSVFLISIASGKLEIVKLILQYLLCGGISKRSLQATFSPLSVAVLFGNHSILQYLITQQFDLNGKMPQIGITPLMIATAMEDSTAFSLLIASKADPSIKNFIGMTASDIKKSREVKEDKPAPPPPAISHTLKPPQLTPAQLISNSPHMSPFTNGHFIGPQPTFIVMTPEQATMHHLRKSTDAVTPSPNYFIATPHLTPISTMTLVPQIFFPSDFNTSISPGMYSNSLLNARLSPMNQSGMYVSPSYNPQSGFPSPCG